MSEVQKDKVTDYLLLEKEFRKFRKDIIEYQILLLRYLGRSPVDAKIEITRIPPAITQRLIDLKSKLTQKYGFLAANIHGMAGYTEKSYDLESKDIFMAAFTPFSVRNFRFIHWGIMSSIQCLDRAIGSCQYARSNEIERKGNQIYIHRGATLPGFREILSILKEAKTSISIRDRYVSEELITMINTLSMRILVKILIMREKYKEKPSLKLIYDKYRQHKNNIEIREIPKNTFHSRQIIIDDQKTYELTFSIKDVGNSEGIILILDATNTIKSITGFSSDWNSGTPL